MVFIIIGIIAFLLFYILVYSNSESKRKNNHKKYMSIIKDEKNSVKQNLEKF